MTIKAPVLCVAALLAGGCALDEHRPQPVSGVPNVVGLSLEDAKGTLKDAGLSYAVATPNGETPIVDHFWKVCAQDPPPGSDVYRVVLDVDREC